MSKILGLMLDTRYWMLDNPKPNTVENSLSSTWHRASCIGWNIGKKAYCPAVTSL
jgi:hypothetical protein